MYYCINCNTHLEKHELRCSFCPHCDKLLEIDRVQPPQDAAIVRVQLTTTKPEYV